MMRTQRGIVCEMNKKHAVFLTNKGEFIRGIPVGETPRIGEEVDFQPVLSPTLHRKKAKVAGIVVMASVLFFFILVSIIPFNEKVMAYVQMDVEKSLEFGVNKKGDVISLRSLNEPSDNATTLLNEWKDGPLQVVLNKAVEQFSGKSEQGPIIITTIYSTSGKQTVQNVVENAVQEVQHFYKERNVEIGESTVEERALANKKNLSVHKFKKSKRNPTEEEKESTSNIDTLKNAKLGHQKSESNTIEVKPIPPKPAKKESVKSNESSKAEMKRPNPPDETPKTNNRQGKLKEPQTDKKATPSNPKQNNGNPHPASEQMKGKSTHPKNERKNDKSKGNSSN